MCFSASASFTAAGVISAIGVAAVTRVSQPRELPLALMPVLFGVQQAVEGALWLCLPNCSPAEAPGLILAFLLIAQVVWPTYLPATVLLVEPDRRRRLAMFALLALGAGVSIALLFGLLIRPPTASVDHAHIVYRTFGHYPEWGKFAYLSATTLPLLLSSRRTLNILGGVILIGAMVAYTAYWQAFVSIWCFFAAAASVVVLAHFQWVRRGALESRRAESSR